MFISGIGSCGLAICPVVIIQQQFDKSYAFPMGIFLWLGSLGGIVGAPLFELLSEYYGWRGSLLITSAMMLNTSVCGLLLTPSNKQLENDSHTETDNIDDRQKGEMSTDSTTQLYGSIQDKDKTDTKGKKQLIEYFDFEILTDKMFVLYMISRMMSRGSGIVMVQDTPGRAVAIGFSTMEASVLASIMTIGMTISRFISSILITFPCISCKMMHCVANLMTATLTLAYTFCYDLPSMYVVIGGFGLCSGKYTFLSVICSVNPLYELLYVLC